jgi:cytochrome c-type biogenesis protein CcmH
MYKVIFLFCLSFFAISANAEQGVDKYVFATAEQKQQFDRISQELRCVVCQNQTLADSDAPLAADLRNEIAAQVKQGNSDQAIFDFVVARYGDFVLYKPPLKPLTWILWFAPILLLLLCLGIWYSIVTRAKAAAVLGE